MYEPTGPRSRQCKHYAKLSKRCALLAQHHCVEWLRKTGRATAAHPFELEAMDASGTEGNASLGRSGRLTRQVIELAPGDAEKIVALRSVFPYGEITIKKG